MPSQIAEVDRFSISAILFLTVPLNLPKLLLKTSVSLPFSLFGSLSLSLLGPLSYMCTFMGAVAVLRQCMHARISIARELVANSPDKNTWETYVGKLTAKQIYEIRRTYAKWYFFYWGQV